MPQCGGCQKTGIYVREICRCSGHGDQASCIGKPFWGRGYMPEAAAELLRHGFEDLGMTTVWCGYYDGNKKSERAQEKMGFQYHHTCNEVPVTLLNEVRVGHTNYMTLEMWNDKK